MSKVSYILPAYKRRYLKEAIDSILAQTYRDFELVIVDDKSPERLYDVIEEYSWENSFEMLPDGGKKWLVGDIPVRYYQNSENIGGKDLVAAWNYAMGHAKGEFGIVASDDDVYSRDFLQEMIRLSDKYPNVDVFHCRIAFINADGDIVGIGGVRSEYETPVEALYSSAIAGGDIRAPDVMFRVQALRDIGGFVNFPRAWCTDLATWIKLGVRNGSCCSSKLLFKWRQSGENISSVYNDVKLKNVALKSYTEFLVKISEGLVPMGDTDMMLLSAIKSQIQSRYYSGIRVNMRRAPMKEWLSAFFSTKLPCYVRYRLVFDKLKEIIH